MTWLRSVPVLWIADDAVEMHPLSINRLQVLIALSGQNPWVAPPEGEADPSFKGTLDGVRVYVPVPFSHLLPPGDAH